MEHKRLLVGLLSSFSISILTVLTPPTSQRRSHHCYLGAFTRVRLSYSHVRRGPNRCLPIPPALFESKSICYAAVQEPSPRTCERLHYAHHGPIPAQNDAGWNFERKWGCEGALGSEETPCLRQELEWRLGVGGPFCAKQVRRRRC
jgi:hypothetical protein